MLTYARFKKDPVKLLQQLGKPLLLRGGERLYKPGDAADAVYLVVSGRVRIFHEDAMRVVREAGPGEILGAVSVYMNAPRGSWAVAIRDTRLLKVEQGRFAEALQRNPKAMWAFGRMCLTYAQRRQEEAAARQLRRSLQTVAVVPCHEGLPVEQFCVQLQKQLREQGDCQRLHRMAVDAALGPGMAETGLDDEAAHLQVLDWLTQQEDSHRFVLYQAETGADTAWTRRCLRQADRVILLAHASKAAKLPEVLEKLPKNQATAVRELVFLDAPEGEGRTPWTWRERCSAEFHHWVDVDAPESVARLGRLLTGQALCLVLGGGGARGAAHLGLLQAMEQQGLKPDYIGGTSVGAIIGAMVAQNWDSKTVVEAVRHLFVDNNFLNDYAVPRVSLIGGKKMRRELEALFGDRRIELLPLPYFCVSTNLSRSEPTVHHRGSVAHWVGASASVPGIAPPVVYQGDLLVDGALLNNVPVDVMVAAGRGEVIASDVTAAENLHLPGSEVGNTQPDQLPRRGRQNNIFKILLRSATVLSPAERARRESLADLYLRMPVGHVGMFDWSQTEELMQAARTHAEPLLDQWLAQREASSSNTAK